MTVTVASFRAGLPAFADAAKYPDAEVEFWLGWAVLMLNSERWSDWLDLGVMMFVAHNLSLEARSKKAVLQGGSAGGQNMVVASTSVDKVSVAYDATAGLEADAGHWNLTNYGTRLLRMMLMVGAGPMTIAGGSLDENPAGAWPGPWTGSIPNPSG